MPHNGKILHIQTQQIHKDIQRHRCNAC